MVSPHRNREGGNGDGREDQALVAEDRLAAEDREDLRNDAEERQRDDVHLGVTEEPEQVLPEHRSPVIRIKDVCTQTTVGTQCEQRSCQRREGHQDQDRGDQGVPGEDRHAPHGHARCAQADDGGNEVHCTQDGAEAGQCQTEDPQVTTDARRERGVGQRCVSEPTEARGALRSQVAGQGNGRTQREEPERQGVQARERHVGRTNLQGHHHVREARKQRGGEHQQHHGAVHGEQLVVLFLGLHDLHARLKELGTDQQCHHTTDAEEHKRRNEVHVPNLLVVRAGDVVNEDASL